MRRVTRRVERVQRGQETARRIQLRDSRGIVGMRW
jgi:hypothetical protein